MGSIYWIVILLLCYLIVDNSLVAFKEYKQGKKAWKLILRSVMLFAILLIVINLTTQLLNVGFEIALIP